RSLDPIDAKDAKLIAAIRRDAPVGEPARTFSTDSQGRYRVDGIGPGSYVAVAFSAALAPGSSEGFTIRSGSDTSDVRITMHPGVLVQGRVVGRDGPVPGASVIANTGSGESAAKVAAITTSAQGEFTLRALSGTITLAVSAPGYGVVERQLALGDYGPRRREDFSLLLENAQLRGQVLAADGGAAPNVTVRIVEGPTRRQAITDRAGRFTIERAAAGNYVLEVGGGDFPLTRAAAQADRWTEVRLERGGQLKIDLRDARSVAPLAGLVVEARGPGDRTATATTDASGIANLRALALGEWTLEVRAKGYTKLSRTVTVRAAVDDVRLVVARSTTLAGVVRDRRGARVPNVRVFTDGVSTMTDSLGNFRLPDAPAGTYWLEAEVDGVRGAIQLQIQPGDERTTIELELQR
ncbi:MAG: carboxypeptidase regulatory-like domain-containing protein, partial [Deltaproteobacteria bacterium]|nr:carboxypeptidase regulatory-like domain-containing protein [Deltaproteobacteria bacterium]